MPALASVVSRSRRQSGRVDLGARAARLNVLSIDRAPLAPGSPSSATSKRGRAMPSRLFQRQSVPSIGSSATSSATRTCSTPSSGAGSTPGLCPRFVCTVKFQARRTTRRRGASPNYRTRRLLHLSHNRHELTWLCGVPFESGPGEGRSTQRKALGHKTGGTPSRRLLLAQAL